MTIREKTACFLSKLIVRYMVQYIDDLLNRLVNGRERNIALSLIHCNQSLIYQAHFLYRRLL